MGPVALRAFLDEYRVRFPVRTERLGDGTPVRRTMRAYHMRGTPTTILIDAEGAPGKSGSARTTSCWSALHSASSSSRRNSARAIEHRGAWRCPGRDGVLGGLLRAPAPPRLLCCPARMGRLFLSSAAVAIMLSISPPSWADKIAVLPFTSPTNVPRPELEEIRRWTREAVAKQGHTCATDDEMVSAEAAVKDGTADTSQEHVAAGRAVGADWTLTGRVERIDHPPVPERNEEGYITYRLELEVAQVSTGRVESLSREVLRDEGPNDITEMIALLIRPEGIANAEIPWVHAGPRRPKARPKPPAPPRPEQPPQPEGPPEPRRVYGEGHPLAAGASIGVTNAVARPEQARGPSWAMPIGLSLGYALPDKVPGLEIRGNFTSQVIGPRALEISAGARYALAPFRGVRLFIGPELLLGAHVALGADKVTRFLAHGSVFLAVGITENVQAEIAGDLMPALGGSGTLLLGGGTARVFVRF
jgi:hypothetical protein